VVDAHSARSNSPTRWPAWILSTNGLNAMMSSDKARAPFDLNQEKDKLRDEYGRNAAGQRLLLAPPSGTAGVRFVSLTLWRFGRIHDNIKERRHEPDAELRPGLPPRSFRTRAERPVGIPRWFCLTTEFAARRKSTAPPGSRSLSQSASASLTGGWRHQRRLWCMARPTRTAATDNDSADVPDYAATVYHLLGVDYEKTFDGRQTAT